ncbi:hypothetical protein [Conexibacter arvalis]|uniref:ABC-type uncharacterized transport system involved in gliding motility auxiliary subunit n=1 Tax=Conexibacter arvalis TaxID=912552 RepID=A0A840IBF8_9ACTN|nr:hypothetical protein [Conexibacter arvalis]MBB4661573.1 ABC-type uncharacterized transport system involved in gliding motility auxiliary subunit [Conexibacter arvalis]
MSRITLWATIILGLAMAQRVNAKAWDEANRSVQEAATLYGERLREQDRQQERMMMLAARQVRLGWLALFVAVGSLLLALVALFV